MQEAGSMSIVVYFFHVARIYCADPDVIKVLLHSISYFSRLNCYKLMFSYRMTIQFSHSSLMLYSYSVREYDNTLYVGISVAKSGTLH